MTDEADILCERRGRLGLITLNRPKALNALNLGMVREMRRALDAWEADPAISAVAIRGAGERAFCAGGDIRALYDFGKAGRAEEARTFWREEYQLNVRIKRYAKPYVALVDGIVMGGGVGVSLHGSHRIAGDNFSFAMPEVGIGFFPDVGATYALPRLPDAAGVYLALTGERIGRADAMAFDIATHAARSADFDAICADLADGASVDEVLKARTIEAGEGALAPHHDLIARCFAEPDVATVLAKLDAQAATGSEFAAKTAATIRTKSPTSLLIAAEQMRRGPDLSFEDAMKLEYRIVSRILDGVDFYEGVRAAVVDKDRNPLWSPADLADVPSEVIAQYFAPLPDELDLTGPSR